MEKMLHGIGSVNSREGQVENLAQARLEAALKRKSPAAVLAAIRARVATHARARGWDEGKVEGILRFAKMLTDNPEFRTRPSWQKFAVEAFLTEHLEA